LAKAYSEKSARVNAVKMNCRFLNRFRFLRRAHLLSRWPKMAVPRWSVNSSLFDLSRSIALTTGLKQRL